MKREFLEAYVAYAQARNAFIDASLKAGKTYAQIATILAIGEFQVELIANRGTAEMQELVSTGDMT